MQITRLEELRKIHLEIRDRVQKEDSADIQKEENKLLAAVEKILEFSRLVEKEGLLALMDVEENSPEEELRMLISLVVDGLGPRDVLEIGMTRYYAGLYSDYDALRYWIYFEGLLAIQRAEVIYKLERKLKVMLPSDLYLKYSAQQKQREEESSK